MKNFFKDIKNWSASLKLGSAIVVGGVALITASVFFASNPTSSNSENSYISQTTPNTSYNDPIVEEEVEEVIRPYTVNAEVAHYFYDETDDASIREKAIVSVPGSNRTYMLSEGCDYVYNNTSFDVVAVVSGVISEKLNDATFGDILILTHESGTKFIYASLSDIKVNKGQKVKQGEIIAKSGTSLYTTTLGNSLHFEVTKDGKNLNPEKIYSSSVENL